MEVLKTPWSKTSLRTQIRRLIVELHWSHDGSPLPRNMIGGPFACPTSTSCCLSKLPLRGWGLQPLAWLPNRPQTFTGDWEFHPEHTTLSQLGGQGGNAWFHVCLPLNQLQKGYPQKRKKHSYTHMLRKSSLIAPNNSLHFQAPKTGM